MDTLKKLDELSDAWCRGEPTNLHAPTLLVCGMVLTEVLSEADPAPAWHRRPTGPGWWVLWNQDGTKLKRPYQVVAYVSDSEFSEECLFVDVERCYGPIPEPPKETSHDERGPTSRRNLPQIQRYAHGRT